MMITINRLWQTTKNINEKNHPWLSQATISHAISTYLRLSRIYEPPSTANHPIKSCILITGYLIDAKTLFQQSYLPLSQTCFERVNKRKIPNILFITIHQSLFHSHLSLIYHHHNHHLHYPLRHYYHRSPHAVTLKYA